MIERYICNVTLRLFHETSFCRGKAISMTDSECVYVALVIQHAKRMHCIILPSVVSLGLSYFSTLSNKRQDFRKKVI